MTRQMQIGAFARLVGVSVKTLRFYADEGLLHPAETDPSSGYRYYLPDQVATATKILNLRTVGMGLADIRTLLAPEENAAPVTETLRAQRHTLLRERARIDAQIAAADTLLASIDREGVSSLGRIRVTVQEPEFVYSRRAASSADVTPLFEQAEADVAEAAGRANRPPFLIVHEADEFEVCVPVTDQAVDALDARLVGAVTVAASATYQGAYHQTRGVEAELRMTLEEAGLAAGGPLREIYQRFGAGQQGYTLPAHMLAGAPGRFVTELQLPITQQDAP